VKWNVIIANYWKKIINKKRVDKTKLEDKKKKKN